MSYDHDPKYAHPFITNCLHAILERIQSRLSNGFTCRLVSAHRTPADQFELFKQGRSFRDGKWIVTNRNAIVTEKDGFVRKSRHNYLPCVAIDFGLFDAHNKYIGESQQYNFIQEGEAFGFEWGGHWTSLVDKPHLQILFSNLFQKDLEKDNGFIWQQLLANAGTYKASLDGIFGPKSLQALQETTGETERNMKAWDSLLHHVASPLAPISFSSTFQ